MIKPIIYNSFEEKEALEKELMATRSNQKRSASKALMNIFSRPEKKNSASKSSTNKR